jgi:hypothetical protein
MVNKTYLDLDRIISIYKDGGVIEVINTYHKATTLVLMDDFAEEVDDIIEEDNDSMIDELTTKIIKEL